MFATPTEVIVRVELPNVDSKAVDITVHEDMLTLKGETKHEEECKERTYFFRELVYGAFTRTLRLPTAVKGTETKAVYKDGVLEVTQSPFAWGCPLVPQRTNMAAARK